MAILVNTELSVANIGAMIPAGAIIKPITHFPEDLWVKDQEGNYTGEFTRRIVMDLPIYYSKQFFQEYNSSIGQVKEFPPYFSKQITNEEFTALMANGALAEVWLRDYLNGILGEGVCTIIDPYTP